MAFYKTQIKSVGAGYATDVSGVKLRFIGNYPCKAGDTVWTDGSVIFGNLSNVAQPVLDVNNSGIPALGYKMRGYFDKAGNFKEYKILSNFNDRDLNWPGWFVSSNNKCFYQPMGSDWWFQDVEVTDDNNVFFISSSWEFDDDLRRLYHIYVDGLSINTSSYSLDKLLNDDVTDYITGLDFLKLQKGNSSSEPVKWFAAVSTTDYRIITQPIPDTKKYTITQHKEKVQNMDRLAGVPEIWEYSVEVKEETVTHSNPVEYSYDTADKFTIDSDGNKNVFYREISEHNVSPYTKSFYVPNEKIETRSVDEETTYGYISPPNLSIYFEGRITVEWAGFVYAKYTYSGTGYYIVDDKILIDVVQKSGTPNVTLDDKITYPVSNGFYIEAKNANSALKLYDADGSLILDFASSGDDILAGLTGFHNFAAVAYGRGYLLTLHKWRANLGRFEYAHIWIIKDGKATLFYDRCFNYRLNKMQDISKARR